MPKNTLLAAAPGLPKSDRPAASFIDPSAFLDKYGLQVAGGCMEPALPDGGFVACSRSEPYAPGDYVILWFRPECVPPGHEQALVKRLVLLPPPWVKFPYRDHPDSEVRAAVTLEMLKPRGIIHIKCADLPAIHKCLGPIAPDQTYRASKRERDEIAFGPRRAR